MSQELKPQDTSVPKPQEERKRTKQRRKKKSVKFSDVLFWFSMHRQAALFLLPVAAAVFAFLIAPAVGSSVGMASVHLMALQKDWLLDMTKEQLKGSAQRIPLRYLSIN